MTETVVITDQTVEEFTRNLVRAEKSRNTVEKYRRDVSAFTVFSSGTEITKETGLAWKNSLIERGYAVRSVNSMLASLNSLFTFIGRPDLRLSSLRIQQQIFRPGDRELTKAEYFRLVLAADRRTGLMLQTICSTGIRVSELRFITVEAAMAGEASVSCKGKTRAVILIGELQKMLLSYSLDCGITSGCIFLDADGQPMDRVAVWREMKKLCPAAQVDPGKVYPHNLRHLFARSFYEIDRDIAKLADVLGHSSIDTTRIYIISSGDEHRKKMEQMGMLICEFGRG